MKNLLFVVTFLMLFCNLKSQTIIVNDSAQYGYNRPRVTILDNDVPYVIWGKPGTASKVFGSKLVAGSFTTPVQLSPDTMDPRVGTVDGPNIVSHGDSIYVVWSNENAAYHHVYLSKSTNGGNSYELPIQVDTIMFGNNIEYPGIAVSENGTLGIFYIQSDASFNNPRQSLNISTDRGATYSKDSTVNSFAPGQTCECCQASMKMLDTNWVFYYRNNVANVRSAYNLVSSNSGASFNDFYEMDGLGWVTPTCPTSGPEGYINGNESLTAWMSKSTGSTRVWYNRLDITTGTVYNAAYTDSTIASNIVQNYPAVAGSGDTAVIVWQDNRYLLTHTFATISIDGGQSFLGTILLSDSSVVSSYTVPHVAYKNGIFHFVWRSSNKIFYKSATLSNLLSISKSSANHNQIGIYPNPAKDHFTIESKHHYNLTITSAVGQLLYFENNITETNKQVDVSNYSKGILLVRIEAGGKVSNFKVVKE